MDYCNTKNKLITEANKFIQLLVPFTYDIDRCAALPDNARRTYAIGSVLISKLSEDDDIFDADNMLHIIDVRTDILPCPKDYLANILKDIIFQVICKAKDFHDEEMDRFIDFYTMITSIWTKYCIYSDN